MKREDFKIEDEVRDGVHVSKELKACWEIMLDMLEELIRVCEKYDLHYSMDGGSLLGTVRHKGFIPWDDDIDVAMPREDYDKLVKVLPGELKYPLIAQHSLWEREYPGAFLRIVNCQTSGIYQSYSHMQLCFCMGISLDIFPIDAKPESPVARRLAARLAQGLRVFRMFTFLRRRQPLRRRWLKLPCRIVWFLFGNKFFVWLRELPFRMFAHWPTGYCATAPANFLWANHTHREKKWFDSYVDMPFEYLTVKVPSEYEKILSQIYGKDWREPKRGLACHAEKDFFADRCYKSVLVEKHGYKAEDVAKLT